MMKRKLAAFALAAFFAVVAPVTAFAGNGRSYSRPMSYEHHYPYHSYHHSHYEHEYPHYWSYWSYSPYYHYWDYYHWWEHSESHK